MKKVTLIVPEILGKMPFYCEYYVLKSEILSLPMLHEKF
jgi:hypothetical protein